MMPFDSCKINFKCKSSLANVGVRFCFYPRSDNPIWTPKDWPSICSGCGHFLPYHITRLTILRSVEWKVIGSVAFSITFISRWIPSIKVPSIKIVFVARTWLVNFGSLPQIWKVVNCTATTSFFTSYYGLEPHQKICHSPGKSF